MELRHLRYFTAVAEEASFTRAAARLHVTQPALSRQIRDLEEELGVELIIRGTSGGTVLSPAGKAFLPDAHRILELSSEAALNVRKFAECRQHALAIGYIAPALGSFLATSLQVFGQRHPQVKVSLYELSPAKQIDALKQGKLDIALIGHACPELEREFDLFSIRSVPICAVLPEGHRFAKSEEVSIRDLVGERFIGLAEESFPGRNDFIRDVCRQAGFNVEFAAEADGLTSALAMIGAGIGITLMPDEVADLPHRHVVFRALTDPAVHIDFHAAVCLGEKRPIVRSILEEFRANVAISDF
ncbi:LysR substrate-binding domain-containing protein [Verrucomicrobiota bacterium sgz303538]